MELYEGIKFYQNDGFYNIDSVCIKLLKKSSPSQRYKIAELCLRAACQCDLGGDLAAKLLWKIANGLHLNKDRFIAMIQTIKPFDINQPRGLAFTLGITENMSTEAARKRLNEEYRKWNCRVNHPDKFIKQEVEQMLELIARAHSKYVEVSELSISAVS